MKSLVIFLVVSTLMSVFAMPAPASAGPLCQGAIAEAGKKFIKVLITNSETPSGGQPACIAVPNSQDNISFQDGVRAKILLDSWSGNRVDRELKLCTDENRYVSVSHSDLSAIRLYEGDDCAVLDSTSNEYQAWRGRPRSAFTFDVLDNTVPNYPKHQARWKIDFPNETKYMFVLGVEQPTQDDTEVLNVCRQVLFKELKPCSDTKFEEVVQFISAPTLAQAEDLLGRISARSNAQCEAIFRKCVADVTKGVDPNSIAVDPYKDDPRFKTPNGYIGPLPECSFSYAGCRDINDLLIFFIKIGETLFQVIGAFAFVMFIYGGLTIILSLGNAEKVKKGQEVLVAAVVGIIIAFSAYLMIDFILNALQVSNDFRKVGTLEEIK